MRTSYYIINNGKRMTDKGLAELVYNNTDVHCYQDNGVKKQIDWIVNNCTNVNDLAVINALQYCWYNLIGISSNRLWKEIDNLAYDYIEAGKIQEW